MKKVIVSLISKSQIENSRLSEICYPISEMVVLGSPVWSLFRILIQKGQKIANNKITLIKVSSDLRTKIEIRKMWDKV